MTLRFCAGGGTVVNAHRPIAEFPYDFVWAGLAPELGCNHLRCSKCGQDVRNEARQSDRHYRCGCVSWFVKQPARLDDPYYDDFMGPAPSSWACAGHPRPRLPFELDGETIDERTDWRALVRGAILGERATARPSSLRQQPVLWLERLFRLLEPGPSVEVRDLAGDDDPRVRAAISEFLRRYSTLT